ncbi:RNA 2',3'-cyclic phosphodiesterase [Marinitoga litoralis]|jgi:2'-5' RNA ligase|uniref:RNA 2',3'-cyclic phosphodiesterase n=1 Tax=Marinitoga litoralis TaxID=570855 RepID=UPI001960B611|nr:RNA 2',3'-cyclic phosphodiesterase [Marinitoga litoralis]MBM7560116.1 2'-5' RNA ligase [Marinitoga litoralis]
MNNKNKHLRTFIALDVNESVQGILRDTILKLERMGFKGNWTKPENLHLTLHFLGDTPVTKITEVAKRMEERIVGFPTFAFNVDKIGYFKSNNHPRVIWMGVEGGNTLKQLHNEIIKSLKLSNIQVTEEEFTPHLTVGRIKKAPEFWEKLIKVLDIERVIVPVSAVHIYSSTLTRTGPIYKKMYSIDFEGGMIING